MWSGKRKSVLLFNLPSPWLIDDRDCPPRGILSIASYLIAHGVGTEFIDLAGTPPEDWMEVPYADLYGISSTTPQYPYALMLIKKIREQNSKAEIVLGGVHPTVLPEQTFRESGATWVVQGEGEEVMERLTEISPYPGVIRTPMIKNLDDLPLPAFSLLSPEYIDCKTNRYVGGTREGVVQTARGCPYNCNFCCQAKMWRGKVRFRSIGNVAAEMKKWISPPHNCDQIYFNDDTFILNRERLKSMCIFLKEAVREHGFLWHCLTRVDQVTIENISMLAEAGCKAVTFGVESGSQKVLDLMNKRTQTESALLSIMMAKSVGLKVRAQMIVGFPGETDETVEETARFVKKAPADVWGFHAFVPYPGCAVWDDPKRFGFSIPDGVSFGDFHTIGKPDEWHRIISPNELQIRDWLSYLQQVAGEKNIYRKIV